MKKETKVRGLPRNWIIEQYENNSDITEEMKEKMTEYLLLLHGIKENSKSLYVLKAKMLGTKKNINQSCVWKMGISNYYFDFGKRGEFAW